VYSSIVSLRGIRMLTYIAEHNGLEVWAMDIGNAYLEMFTKEKVYIIAGPEFGPLEGHTLLINKAIYGLKSSGLRWSERFSDVLVDMGFFLSKAEMDIWMHEKDGAYEYIGVYVDNLFIISKNPKAIMDALVDDYKFKLKGTGPVEFHLGCDFFRDVPLREFTRLIVNQAVLFHSLAISLHKDNIRYAWNQDSAKVRRRQLAHFEITFIIIAIGAD
jgi:hypothetical protein